MNQWVWFHDWFHDDLMGVIDGIDSWGLYALMGLLMNNPVGSSGVNC